MQGLCGYMRRASRLLAVAASAAVFLMLSVRVCPADAGPRLFDADGLTVVVQEARGPLAAVCVFVGSGNAYETPAEHGITSLLNSAVVSTDTAVGLEELGGILDTYTGGEYSCFRLAVPVKNLPQALKLLGGALAAPSLGEPDIRAEKRGLLCRAGAAEDMPVELGYSHLMMGAYPGGSYDAGPTADHAPAAGINAKELAAWQSAYYVRGNIVVSVCADVDAETAKRLVSESFSGLKPGPRASAAKMAGNAAGPAQTAADDGASSQTAAPGRSVALVAFQSPPAGSSDYAAMRVVEAAIADGMGSMLFRAYRLDGKLAYYFGGVLPETATGAGLTFYVGTDKDHIDGAVGKILECARTIKRGELDAASLARARARAEGGLVLETEGVAGLAWMDGLAEITGLGQGYWDKLADRLGGVGPADVAGAAIRYMGGHKVVVVPSGTQGG